MKKRKLIEVDQECGVVCDNPVCDFEIKNETGDPNVDIDMYLNVPCPRCGDNLLTEGDLYRYKKFLRVINFINKWFSWLVIFSSGKNYKEVKVSVHNEIKLEIEK